MSTQQDKLKGKEQVSVPLGYFKGALPTTNGDMIMESAPMPFDGVVNEIHAKVGIIPAASDSFTFNAYGVNEGAKDYNMFSAAQSFGYSDNPTEFVVSVSSTLTSYLAQVTGGAGHAQLDALASTDFFYIISDRPRDADNFNMDGAEVNSNGSVLTGEYWNGTAWVSASVADGTILAGKTMGQDGVVSWNPNLRRLWRKTKINGVTGFVMRYSVSVDLSATVSVDELLCRRIANVPYKYSPKYPEKEIRTGDRILINLGTKESSATVNDLEMVALVSFDNQHPRA